MKTPELIETRTYLSADYADYADFYLGLF